MSMAKILSSSSRPDYRWALGGSDSTSTSACLQKLLGDFTFEVDGDIDTHHGWATYAWVQHPPYNGRTVTGREVIRVVDGRVVFLFMVIHDLEFPEPPD